MAEEAKSSQTTKVKDNTIQTVVYSWGTGRSGELGHTNLDKSQTCLLPSPITYFSNKSIQIDYIACGEGYSCAISSNHHLYTWGLKYKLGIGEAKDTQKTPILVKYFINKKELIDKVSCGECHTGVITKNHNLYL
eukprot:772846_1